MSPREFKRYIFEEMTYEEIESLMVDERQRRKSFHGRQLHDGDMKAMLMAQCGFYSIGRF